MEKESTYLHVGREGIFEIKAGSIHAVIVGTEFAVTDKAITSPSTGELCILAAVLVDSTSSMLALRPGDEEIVMANEARASVFNWKNDGRTLKVDRDDCTCEKTFIHVTRA